MNKMLPIDLKEVSAVSGGSCVENWFEDVECVCYFKLGGDIDHKHFPNYEGSRRNCKSDCFLYGYFRYSYHTPEDKNSCGTRGFSVSPF